MDEQITITDGGDGFEWRNLVNFFTEALVSVKEGSPDGAEIGRGKKVSGGTHYVCRMHVSTHSTCSKATHVERLEYFIRCNLSCGIYRVIRDKIKE